MAIGCETCIHLQGAILAGEDREHLTPCWDCGDYHRNYVNKFCSTCKYRDMDIDDDPLCSECGDNHRMWSEG